jgi:hypothetical protein
VYFSKELKFFSDKEPQEFRQRQLPNSGNIPKIYKR